MHPRAQATDSASSLSRLASSAERHFRERFGRSATHLVAAPGRVNLIGEHIDYNDGFVLPMAISRYVVLAAAPARRPDDMELGIYSAQIGESATFSLNSMESAASPAWSRYVWGTARELQTLGLPVRGFDVAIVSHVPLGAGLSSSAALEVATATLIESLTGHRLDPIAKALACQRAEHNAVGVPCGIMDQFSSTLGRERSLLLIDCQSQQVTYVPFEAPEIAVLVINSHVRHDLASGEYAARRGQCERAKSLLGAASFRDVDRADLDREADRLGPLLLRRARHVVTEIDRTFRAVEGCRHQAWEDVGQWMYESHASLRDDYEVSCDEIDRLVEIARDLGVTHGVLGGRLTGGGFGGCTVNLVRLDALDEVTEAIRHRYAATQWAEPSMIVCVPASGAHVIRAPE